MPTILITSLKSNFIQIINYNLKLQRAKIVRQLISKETRGNEKERERERMLFIQHIKFCAVPNSKQQKT